MKKEKIATINILSEDVIDFVHNEKDAVVLLDVIRNCCVKLSKENLKPVTEANIIFSETIRQLLKNLQSQMEK